MDDTRKEENMLVPNLDSPPFTRYHQELTWVDMGAATRDNTPIKMRAAAAGGKLLASRAATTPTCMQIHEVATPAPKKPAKSKQFSLNLHN